MFGHKRRDEEKPLLNIIQQQQQQHYISLHYITLYCYSLLLKPVTFAMWLLLCLSGLKICSHFCCSLLKPAAAANADVKATSAAIAMASTPCVSNGQIAKQRVKLAIFAYNSRLSAHRTLPNSSHCFCGQKPHFPRKQEVG